MESVCPICKKPYDGVNCTNCTVTDLDVSALVAAADGLQVQSDASVNATAFLVDLVSNRKIPITTPKCKVGRDDLNDIVISGDQSISRFHFVISRESAQYYVQDGKSRHGTFLNGNQIGGPEAIHDGDVLKVGVSLFWFVIEAAALTGSDKTAPVDVVTTGQSTGPMVEAIAPVPMVHEQPMLDETIVPAARASSHEHSKSNSRNETKSLEPVKVDGNGQAPPVEPAHRPDFKALGDQIADSEREDESKTPSLHVEPLDQPEPIQQSEPVKPLEALHQPEPVSEPEPAANASDEHAEFSQSTGYGSDLLKPEPDNHSLASDTLAAEENMTRTTNSQSESYSKEDKSEAAESGREQTSSEPTEAKAQETLEKFAEILGEAKAVEEKRAEPPLTHHATHAESADRAKDTHRQHASSNKQHDKQHDGEPTSNGAKSVIMSMTLKDSASSTVPDWCKKYFATELNHLNKEVTDLNDQVRNIQNKIKDVEGRVALTKGLRNVLLTAQGDDLVEACSKVLSMVGWRVKVSDDDKHELRLESDDKNISIVRIVWTEKDPDRSHLGQLSISQTRFWCEQGVEPKGILILSRVGDNNTHPITPGEIGGELAEYAQKKNVCVMSTLQLLTIYKDIALHDGNAESIRTSIHNANGWLHGFHLEPGSDSEPAESSSTNKLSSLLSA